MTDISQLKQSEAQLEHLAHYDALTDLPNRLLMQSRLGFLFSRPLRADEFATLLPHAPR